MQVGLMLSMKDKSRKQVEKDEFEYLLFEMKKLYYPPIILVGHRLYSFSLLNRDSDLLNGYVSRFDKYCICQFNQHSSTNIETVVLFN